MHIKYHRDFIVKDEFNLVEFFRPLDDKTILVALTYQRFCTYCKDIRSHDSHESLVKSDYSLEYESERVWTHLNLQTDRKPFHVFIELEEWVKV